jgi:hypothetical protein
MSIMSYKLEKKIVRKGFPTADKHYATAHEEASKAEKKRYPSGYAKLKKLDEKIPAGQLIGKNFKSGKVEVSKAVPAKQRSEVAMHERFENKKLRKMDNGK